jgi:glycosyltransferase involved in cell wall biosynthesis
MKVALIYLGRRGGIASYSYEIAMVLKEKAEVFSVVSEQVENIKEWEQNFPSLCRVNTYTNPFGFLLSFFNIKRFFYFYKKIKDFSPEVIYYPGFHFWLPIINWLFPKIPKVYTLHDPVLHTGERDWLTKFIQNIIINQSSKIIILSESFCQLVRKRGFTADEVVVIPHGIVNFLAIQQPFVKHSPTILFFGRIEKYKGLDVLFQAFSLIKKRAPEVELIIAGNGKIEDQKKYSQISGIIIENRWIKNEEIASFFLKADILVCPYLDASQSGVIPIAYTFKIPVVASQVGGLVEQVIDGETGKLVPPGDVQKWAEVCVDLLKDEVKRKIMGENGFKKANKEWSWQIIGGKVFAVLQSVKQKRL